jgi:DNA-binding transcriptional LysR family regulator
MEMRHLRYFIAVAEEGHITRAAERLGMQQPPLSQQIKAIERELDVQLFRRKPRGVELTQAGRAFFHHARNITADLDRALETTRRTARGEQGQIRVGITPTSPFNPFVPRVIRAFREAYPLIALTLAEYNSGDLIALLQNERLDAAFIRTYSAAPDGLTLSLLFNEANMVALPEQHRLAGGGADVPIALRSLADETIIVQGGRLGMYADVIAACRAAGINPRIEEGPRLASTLNLVAVGLGVSFVPASLQRTHVDGVVYRRLKGPHQPVSPLTLASRRGDPSAVIRQFLNFIKRAAKTSGLGDPVGITRRS